VDNYVDIVEREDEFMKTISYGRQFIDDDDISAVVDVLKSDYLTQGPLIQKFEEALCEYCGCKYAVLFSNGTAALHGAYYASGIGKGNEFVTTPITFAASANAGLYMNAIPVFCDIDPQTYNIDINKIFDSVSNKTKVVTPVSYAGNPVELEKIYKKLNERGIVVIHDAAHALGAKRNGFGIADFCDMAMVSFHPVKHITTGEGGVILTNNRLLCEKLRLFRNHGITKNPDDFKFGNEPWYYEMQTLGYNYRITDIQCALGLSQLKKADGFLKRRNQIADIYRTELAGYDKFKLVPRYDDKYTVHAFHLYPVLLPNSDERKRFFNYMRQNDVWVQVHYVPLHLMPYYRGFGFKEGDLPKAEDFYSREVSVPMFPSISDLELEYVIDLMKKF